MYLQFPQGSIKTKLAPPVGFEPTTLRLTGERSTIELQGIVETRLFYLNPENISLSLQSSYIKIKL